MLFCQLQGSHIPCSLGIRSACKSRAVGPRPAATPTHPAVMHVTCYHAARLSVAVQTLGYQGANMPYFSTSHTPDHNLLICFAAHTVSNLSDALCAGMNLMNALSKVGGLSSDFMEARGNSSGAWQKIQILGDFAEKVGRGLGRAAGRVGGTWAGMPQAQVMPPPCGSIGRARAMYPVHHGHQAELFCWGSSRDTACPERSPLLDLPRRVACISSSSGPTHLLAPPSPVCPFAACLVRPPPLSGTKLSCRAPSACTHSWRSWRPAKGR